MDVRIRDTPTSGSIRIGISACLVGRKVRYDGGHKEDRYLAGTLGRYFELVAVCPEVELGLGTPREMMRLIETEDGIGLETTLSRRDLTKSMRDFSESPVVELEKENLSGFVLKSDSPSCGVEDVGVFDRHGRRKRSGRGLFVEALLARFPDLPVVDEVRASNPQERENWIERVMGYHRLQELWERRWNVRDLIEFHAAHEMVLWAHSPRAYQRLGRLVAGAKEMSRRELRAAYQREFMTALKATATRERHVKRSTTYRGIPEKAARRRLET